jgi:hypothetical protein
MTAALTRIAIVGTARAGMPPPAADSPLGDLTAALPADDVERSLLLRAGAEAAYRLAGRRPPADATPKPAPAPPDAAREISGAAAHVVASLLGDAGKRALLIEAATRIAAVGQRLPHRLLPSALEEADASVRAALTPVVGERGRWLARLNDDWQWAARAPLPAGQLPPDAEAIWDEGSFAERVAVVKQLRAADPTQARDWLAEVWSKEKAEQRAELLQIFDFALHPADEPFLEQALDDRSAAVRAEAAAYLSRLPSSALAQRMLARADAMLTFAPAASGGFLRKLKAAVGTGSGTIAVQIPSTIDASWERDGIPAKPPSGVGQKAFWLLRTLAAVPLAHWCQRFEATPPEIVAATKDSEWRETLLDGWTQSLGRFGGEDWIAPLWQAWIDLAPPLPQLQPRLEILFRASRLDEKERRLLEMLTSQRAGAGFMVAAFAGELPRPWRRDFVASLLKIGRTEAASGVQQRVAWGTLLRTVALAVPPALIDAALEPWPEGSKAEPGDRLWERALSDVTGILHTRKKIYEEIRP